MTNQTQILAAIENSISNFGSLGPSGAPRHAMIPEVVVALQALKKAHSAQQNYIASQNAKREELLTSLTFR